MDWCCTRCSHRQDAEVECGACGHDNVHDLCSRRTCDLLDGIEAEHREKKESLARKIAAAGAFVLLHLVVAASIALQLISGSTVDELRPPYFAMPIALGIGLTLWKALERRLYKPRFPFLADLPPADRP